MGTLSDIAAKLKGTLKSIWTGIDKAWLEVASGLWVTKEWIESANKAIQANPTLSAASKPWLSWLIATPKALATEIVPLIWERFRTAQAEYEASWVKNPFADIVSTIGNAPVLFWEWVSGVIDEWKNVLQKVKSGTDVAMSVAQTNPWTAAWNVAYEWLVPADIKKTVNDSISWVTRDATQFWIDNWLSQEDAESLAGIAQNVVWVAASIFWIKWGNVTWAALRKAALPTLGRKWATQLWSTANVATNALIQASPQIIPVVYDYFKNNKDKPGAFTEAWLVTLWQQVATMLPLWNKIKYRPTTSKWSLSKIAEENTAQTKMWISDPIVVKDISEWLSKTKEWETFRIDIQWGTEFINQWWKAEYSDFWVKRTDDSVISWMTEETPVIQNPDQVVAEYKPVEPIVESATNTLSDIAKEQSKAVAEWVIKIETPEQTIARYNAEKEAFIPEPISQFETPEQTIARNIQEWRVTPVKQTLSDIAKDQAQEPLNAEAPNIEPPGWKAPPTVYATELGNILDSLDMGDDVFVSKSKNALNKIGTEGGYIEKWLSKIAGRIINLRNISMTARTSANLFANKILEIAGVDKNNLKLGRDFKIKEEDVIGWITPNEATPITKYSQVAGTLNNMIPNSIKNLIGKDNVNDLKNLSDAEYIYMTNKDNQAKLDSLFSPEEQARFSASVKLSKDVPQQIVEFLKETNLIKDEQVAKDYVRFVLSEYGREKFSKPVTLDIGGKEYKFENMEAAMSATQARRMIKEETVADSMSSQIEAKISSLLKEKWDNIDLFRVHSPTIQLLSYAEGIGKLLQNKATLDNFRKFTETDAKWFTKNPENAKFIEWLFPDKGGSSEILNNMIHIYGREKWFVWATKNIVANTTKYASAWLLAWRLPTFVQPIFSTLPKSAMTTFYNELGKDWVRINYEVNNKNVDASLANNGFMSDMQVFDTAKTNKFDKGLSKVAWESSGAWLERQARRAYALSEMARTLVKNGIDIRWKWRTVDPTELVNAWDKWARDPVNKEQYLVAQDKIQEYLSWMGESNIMSKSMNDTVRKTNFQALTWYANSQVNKALTDIWRAIGKIETGDGQQKEAIGRLVMGAVPYFGTALASLAYLQQQNPEADISELWWLSLKAANKTAGNFLSQWYSIVSWQTSSPILLPVSLLWDLSNIVGESLKWNPDGIKQAFDDLLKKVINTQGGLSTINAATKWEMKQGISDALGTVNTETLTKTGKAKGNKIDSYTEWFERALWLNMDSLLTNYMYGQINDAKIDNMLKEQWVTNPTLVWAFKWTAWVGASLVKDLARPIQEWIDGLTKATDVTNNEVQWIDYSKMAALNDVYKKITPEDTTETILAKLNVDKEFAKDVDTEIQSLLDTEIGKKWMLWSGNERWAEMTDTQWKTATEQGTTGEKLSIIRTTNPKLFNDIIASFWRLHAINTQSPLVYWDRDIAILKDQIFKNSEMTDDAIIAAISWDNPNSTALSQAVMNTYQTLSTGERTPEEIKSWLKVIDSLFWWVYWATWLNQWIERSMAIASFWLLEKLEKEAWFSWLAKVKEMIKNTPNILKAIQNGLTYRWFNSIQPTQWTPTDQPASQVPAPAQWSLSAIASSMYGQKAPKWVNVEHTPAKIEPLIKPTKTMSLSELARSQSSKSQTRKK